MESQVGRLLGDAEVRPVDVVRGVFVRFVRTAAVAFARARLRDRAECFVLLFGDSCIIFDLPPGTRLRVRPAPRLNGRRRAPGGLARSLLPPSSSVFADALADAPKISFSVRTASPRSFSRSCCALTHRCTRPRTWPRLGRRLVGLARVLFDPPRCVSPRSSKSLSIGSNRHGLEHQHQDQERTICPTTVRSKSTSTAPCARCASSIRRAHHHDE